jgi:aminoglycoside phosphotransferase (APT) family kinase protein
MDDRRLVGGFDGGAELVGGNVRRTAGPWTASVHLLLAHLAAVGFEGARRPLGWDDQGREVLTYLPGETVGSARPWPGWTHTNEALGQVADWLRRYHEAVADFEPPADAVWREAQSWTPGLIVAHNDAAPYNAVWDAGRLVGFVDWDMAGPMTKEADLAWMAFSWVPLHARVVVSAEGFSAFSARRKRLENMLARYRWEGTTQDVLDLVAVRIADQLRAVRSTAGAGDATYQRMLEFRRDKFLEMATDELGDV